MSVTLAQASTIVDAALRTAREMNLVPMMFLGAPAISLAAILALCGFVLALKWALLGKVKPGAIVLTLVCSLPTLMLAAPEGAEAMAGGGRPSHDGA